MDITVAICTWNRARLLDRTLAEFRRLRIPPGLEWELLVVDNNSTDETPAIIRRHTGYLPIRALVEPRQGHCHARNCALAAAQGDLLIWTDDDVLADPDWLAAYHQAASQWPDAAFFGGTVDPWYELEPPAWVLAHIDMLRAPFALRQLGPLVRRLKDHETPFGASMAFRRSLLAGETFDTRLGRVGQSLISGDEMDFIARLRRAGRWGVWVGTARVRHWVPRERMTWSYVRRWLVASGRTMVREGPIVGPTILGIPRWVFRSYAQSSLGWWLLWLAKPATRMEWWRRRAVSIGIIAEAWRTARGGGARPPITASAAPAEPAASPENTSTVTAGPAGPG